MGTYSDVNGVPFTDDDVELWAGEAESEAGYTGKYVGPSMPGRPISVGAQARPFTIRLDAVRRAKLDEVARERHTTPSQLMRELIDSLNGGHTINRNDMNAMSPLGNIPRAGGSL